MPKLEWIGKHFSSQPQLCHLLFIYKYLGNLFIYIQVISLKVKAVNLSFKLILMDMCAKTYTLQCLIMTENNLNYLNNYSININIIYNLTKHTSCI